MVQIKRMQESDYDIISPVGEIDARSSIELDSAISQSISEGFKKILIDCHGLEYISSAGLGVFMSYIEEMKDLKGVMIIYNMSEKVANTFEILVLADLLTICKTKNDALKLIHDLSL